MVQQCTSLYIAELRVFAEQKRRQGFLPLTSVSAIGTGWQPKVARELHVRCEKFLISVHHVSCRFVDIFAGFFECLDDRRVRICCVEDFGEFCFGFDEASDCTDDVGCSWTEHLAADERFVFAEDHFDKADFLTDNAGFAV